jgi:hypothetical protein
MDLPTVTSAVQRSFQAGEPGSSSNLSSSQLQSLRAWFDAHATGWNPTLIDYAPSTLISCKEADGYPLSINLFPTSVIVNVPQGQYARSLSPEEASSLFSILRKTNG